MNPPLKLIPLLIILLFSTPGWAQAPDSKPEAPNANIALQRLEGEIRRVAKSAGAVVGVSALHLESGQRIGFQARERFPMASTYKVPIAVELLIRTDRGDIALHQMIELQPRDLRPGGGIITDLLDKPGVVLSVHNLLELMLRVSDNTATDVLLRLAGGPEAITSRLKALGIQDMQINRSTMDLIAASEGQASPPEDQRKPESGEKLPQAAPAEREGASPKFEQDFRDTATPEAMVALLERIARGDMLRAESGALLLDIMERCQTGAGRLKGILPPGTVVAHKTGTLGGTTSDVGIVTLPERAGRVAIAVFVKSPGKRTPQQAKAIAQISRAVYDFFLFHPPAPLPFLLDKAK